MTKEDLADAGAAALLLDDRRIGLPGGLDLQATYDVVINEVPVWSLQPARDTEADGDLLISPWPKALRRHLRGSADVVVRHHVDGTTVATGSHVFGGDAARTVQITDKLGRPLVLDKYGRLTSPLSAEGEDEVDEFLDRIDELLEVLRERAGVPAFICYGTLLGAVRNGRLIGHDNDVDIAYVSEMATPVDVVREAFRVERILAAEGWTVRRGSGSRVNVRIRRADGSVRYVDVFTAHWVEGILYMPSDTGFRLPRETILPLTTVELHGHQMPAPADYERLLAATYGPGWRTPDPSFKYSTPRALSRRLNGWFGGLRTHRKVWDAFYASQGRKLPKAPTSFARWVAATYPSTRDLVDLGSGNGRDARWFARKQGRSVIAIDYSLGVMKRSAARSEGLHVRHEVLNLNDARHVLSLGARLSRTDEPVDLYGRFLLHALDKHGRENVLRLASLALRRGGYLFLEFRTHRDRWRRHTFPSNRREYLRPDEIVAQIESFGGHVVHREEGDGLARFRDEDPHVCRLVAVWSR
jgi:SAM-dependent methyltransferase